MKIIRLQFLLAAFILVPALSFSQTTSMGGRGLFRTLSAENVQTSQLYFNTYFASFLEPNKVRKDLGQDHTVTVGLTLGISRHLEFMAMLTPYQDDQASIWAPPGDTQLGLKFQTPFSGSVIKTAVHLFTRLPTAKRHNVQFEPFSSGKVTAALLGILSLDLTDSFPLLPLKIHANFGYMDHDLPGDPFSGIDDQFIIRSGLKFPIRSTVFFTEYSAEVFANNPLIDEYSLNSQRLTQGIKFLGPWSTVMDLVVDFSLSKKSIVPVLPYIKDYADWKIIFGVNYQMRLKRATKRTRAKRLVDEKEMRRIEKMEEILDKRQEANEEMRRMEESLQNKKSKEKKENN